MDKETARHYDRRRALALIGGGTVALTSLGLAGCGSEESAPKPELVEPQTSAEPTPPPKASETTAPEESSQSSDNGSTESSDSDSTGSANTDANGGDMPKLDENSAQAKQLAYVHDASTISADSQPRYESGQLCSNCALYQGGSDPWGACPLFQGKLVKSTGWCNGYAPAG